MDAGSEEQRAASVLALDAQAQFPAIRRLKAWLLEHLDLQPGMRVLDVGCGTGEDVQAMALLVQPGGSATGIDPSRVMLDEAERRALATRSPATYATGSADRLGADDGSVDVVRCERVLQHVPDPSAALSEVHRVLRRDGRLGVIDTNWRSLWLSPGEPDVVEAVRAAWVGRFPHPAVGAQLPSLLDGTGFDVELLTVETVVLRQRDAGDRPPLTLMAAAAVEAGAVSAEAVEAWLEQVRHAAQRRCFLTTFCMTGVVARRT